MTRLEEDTLLLEILTDARDKLKTEIMEEVIYAKDSIHGTINKTEVKRLCTIANKAKVVQRLIDRVDEW